MSRFTEEKVDRLRRKMRRMKYHMVLAEQKNRDAMEAMTQKMQNLVSEVKEALNHRDEYWHSRDEHWHSRDEHWHSMFCSLHNLITGKNENEDNISVASISSSVSSKANRLMSSTNEVSSPEENSLPPPPQQKKRKLYIISDALRKQYQDLLGMFLREFIVTLEDLTGLATISKKTMYSEYIAFMDREENCHLPKIPNLAQFILKLVKSIKYKDAMVKSADKHSICIDVPLMQMALQEPDTGGEVAASNSELATNYFTPRNHDAVPKTTTTGKSSSIDEESEEDDCTTEC